MAHWVQIELDPNGSVTSCIQWDLERVVGLHIDRQNGAIEGVGVSFEGEVHAKIIRGGAARSFVTVWRDYQKKKLGGLHHQDPEAKPGTIATVVSMPTGIQPGKLN